MNGIYILLGSNIGNRMNYLKEAKRLLIQKRIKVINESSIYETEPYGGIIQNYFLNVVLQIETSLAPKELLKKLLDIENILGRVRNKKWGKRCVDLDILYYYNQIIESKELTVPHIGINERRFTLIPLVELCPLEEHPKNGNNHIKLLNNCTDTLACRLTNYKL